MTRQVRFLDAAELELTEAADFYDLEIRILAVAHQRRRTFYRQGRE